MMCTRIVPLLVLLLAVALPASAQDPAVNQTATVEQDDEETVSDIVVVSVSRREEQLLNAPATVSVLSKETIGNSPGQTVPDLLRLVPGLNTVQSSARDVNV